MATKKPLCIYGGVIKELQSGDDVGASGATTFTALTDVPATYITNGGKFVKVNAGETALEFTALAGGGDMLAANNLSDVANAGTSRTNLGAQATLVSATNIKTINTNSLLGAGDVAVGDMLGTNNLSDVVDADASLNNLLPTQTGNNGKVLQTNGTVTSWQTASGGLTQPQVMARALGC